jgi:putative FmdB family regulatory protein
MTLSQMESQPMPIYEFKCTQCEHEFEDICKRPLDSVTCPKCKVGRADRIEISDTHFKLVGRGWTNLAWDRFR